MTSELPWPESPERVESRLSGLVRSVVRDGELDEVRLDWVTPERGPFPDQPVGYVVLRLTVLAPGEQLQLELWPDGADAGWEDVLGQVAERLEEWVTCTTVARGQERTAVIPD